MLLFAKPLRITARLSFDDKSKGFDKFQEISSSFQVIGWILLVACAVITGILYLIDYKKPNITISKAVPIAFAVVFGLCVAAMIGIMVYFSCIDTKTDLGKVLKELSALTIYGVRTEACR